MTSGGNETPAASGGAGRLAEVIASRGGLAAPEAPFVIEHREALIYMLYEAAELEHGIMCQYLFAACSLKQREDEGLATEELEAVLRWRGVISHVATEEMLHLALVQNLLSAIGSAPHLSRPNLPAPAHHYPAGVNLTLVPFGEPALRHFMFLERPEGMELKGARGIDAPAHDAVPLMSERDIVPQPQDFATVGHLYRSIEQGIAHLADKFGEANLFVGPPRAQATREHFHWPELVAVTGVASAQQAIDTILEQGEGARGDWQDAHFGQFVRILDEYRNLKQANPDFEPARPVIFATVRPSEHDESVPRISERVTSRCGDLFNVSYEVLLQILERFFAHTEETDAQLVTLSSATLALMLGAIKPLGDLLTALPVGPGYPGRTAGPSFELFYENDYLMPHREAAWALLEERLRDAANFSSLIREIADDNVAAQLVPVGETLTRVADSLAGHFEDWGGASRFTTPASPTTRQPDHGVAAELLERAAAMSDAVANAGPTHPETRQLAELFSTCEGTFHNTAAAADGETSAWTAARLLEGAMRPLAEAVTGRPPGTGKRRSRSEDEASMAEGDDGSILDDELWRLARSATRLRAGWSGDTRQGALLAEATAALQHITLELGPDKREERLKALRALQRRCEPGIRCARNGPYLVTNAERLLNWLGEEVIARPQMALCRCGESALKPDCDGACARIGFRDKKDPKRVPDRRDSYDGVQLRIFDNRGICQHSGFCTDRLATVFHADSEPFVTPSGGRMDEIIRAVRDCPSGALSYAIDEVEARAQVDRAGTRQPTIEITKDGPYRIRGAIALSEENGEPVKRAKGSSLEHYALCRCGHSLNKPFCSGMHWYIQFSDPPMSERPTIFEWAGGLPALTRMTRIFYEKYVPEDPLLAPLFANMAADHPERVAKWLAEVFSGPHHYSDEYGGYPRMVSQHLGRQLSEEQRGRWVALLLRSAREAGLPNDAELRAAFSNYIEWGSRLAVENSQPDATPPTTMAMPHWDWNTAAGPPGSRISALASQDDEQEATFVPPQPGEAPSFDAHIKPLFRERDRQSMQFAFDLWTYDDVAAHADDILARVRAGTMPCDGAWPKEKVDAFESWITAGKPR